MRTNYVLIDAENVKLEYIEKLKHEHFRVVVFVGAKKKWLNFDIANAVQSLGTNGCYVQVSDSGPNALDFHIAYHIGKLAAENANAYFHIISKDKGFDPLLKHLKAQKVFCSRWPSVLDIPLVKSTDKLSPKQRAADFYQKRIAATKGRPATVTSLESAVLSHFHKLLSAEEVAKVIAALKTSGHVVVNGKKVAYPNQR